MIEATLKSGSAAGHKGNIGKYRWVILSLVFFATTIIYLDRQVISLLKDDYLAPQFKWTETDYANIVVVFQICYALGMLGAGWLIDKVGTKIGYAVSIAVWSVAVIFHAAARSTLGFMIARGTLGVCEAGNFPVAIKTVAEWFPQKDRALATGLFNSGANIGAIIGPLTVPLIAVLWGWQWAFIIVGSIGFIWLFLWLTIYQIPSKHKKVSQAELNYINSDKEVSANNSGEKVSWLKLFTIRQTWAFFFGKLLTDPVWWFYLYWLPSFLNKQYHMTKTQVALPIAVVYTMTTFGSIFGGWLSGNFIKRGWPVYKARRIAMLIFAICVVPVVFAQYIGKFNPWYAVLIVGLAASAHQAWSANIFTTVSDMFPKKAVGSVIGIGGMAGAVGGIILAKLTGALLDYYKSVGSIESGYYIMFFICGFAYLAAWGIFNVLAPKMKQVNLN